MSVAILALATTMFAACGHGTNPDGSFTRIDQGTIVLQANDGHRLKITAYGDHIIRTQSARKDERFLPDDHYEMVEDHSWPRNLEIEVRENQLILSTRSGVTAEINKTTLAVTFRVDGNPLLTEQTGTVWKGDNISTSFDYDDEHFTGLGHGYFAREDSIDLRGKTVQRNYGSRQIEQAPLIVPFYMSSKGYGVFLNSTFANTFRMGVDGNYSISINDSGFGGQMDYFFIAGPELKSVLDRYTQLTGRPRLPPKAIFGLQLSDKGHDHNSSTPSDEKWWKKQIEAHRAAGFPLDHVVNDNRWRAAGGKRCESEFEWDSERYPDPAEYAVWLREHGLVATLDFNRCIAKRSDGWRTEFNLPLTGKIDFEDSAPDLTNTEFRQWFWQIFYDKSLNPGLNYPGSALWIDEFDEQGAVPDDLVLANGRSSAEMRNYWFFLIAKALVQEGWDKSDIPNRPYVWVRGMTAGAQRYATLWSGDIHPSYDDMQAQIRGMQLAGLSGFPYWAHDAGGFFDWDTELGPDDELYLQWAMAFGSFSPIWKPHGMGQSRWPLDRPLWVQEAARKYMRLRYELMPYLYSYAHVAANAGTPITRAMVLEYQGEDEAWQRDQQYLWGDFLLIAPHATGEDTIDVWLPAGKWYDFETKEILGGDRVITVDAEVGSQPVFVKESAIIPRREYALSTAFIEKRKLIVDVYAGAVASSFNVIEDDEQTDAYRDGEYSVTRIDYLPDQKSIQIETTENQSQFAPANREYVINVFGDSDFDCAVINGERVAGKKSVHAFTFRVASQVSTKAVRIQACSGDLNDESTQAMRVHLYQPESSGSELVYRTSQAPDELVVVQMSRHDDDWWVASLDAGQIEFAFEVDSGRIDLGGVQGCYPGDHYLCKAQGETAKMFRSSSPDVWVKNGLLHTAEPHVNSSDDELTVLTINLHSYQEFNTPDVAEPDLSDALALERVASHGPLFDRVAAAINELDPDIVCLQEVAEWSGGVASDPDSVEFGATDSNMVHQILRRLGRQYHHTMDWSHYGFDVWLEGSAILSKHPLTDSGSRFISRPGNARRDFWKSRNVPMAQIDLPRLGDVAIFSVHAGWWDDEEEPFQEQFGRLTDWAGEITEPGATVIFCGDFNVPAGSEGHQFMTSDTGYSDQYALANPGGMLDATIGGDIDGWEGSSAGKRIDYILINDDSPLEVKQAQRIFTENVFGRVSDHSGVYAHFGSRVH